MEKYLSVKEVADILGVHQETVRRWIHKKIIKAKRFGRTFRINPKDIEKYTEIKDAESF